MDDSWKSKLAKLGEQRVIFLTGAGISAESGIPTFRGPEGYWTVGSTNYQPEVIGTRACFDRIPDEVWCWYLFRRTVCNRSLPNSAHLALAEFEQRLGDRFLLVTQNVDGLHLRAGNSFKRTYQVHGNINYMRCLAECSTEQFPIPDEIGDKERGQSLTPQQAALLVCPKCGGSSRPHILWFDECYDEEWFRFHSSLEAARDCGLLVSVGSSGSTNLPTQMVRLAGAMGAVLVDINPEANPYGRLAEASGGVWMKCGASEGLDRLKEVMSLD